MSDGEVLEQVEVTGAELVEWALKTMAKKCALCHQTRAITFTRGKVKGKDVCGCAVRAFFKAHPAQLHIKGDKVYRQRGIVEAETIDPKPPQVG